MMLSSSLRLFLGGGAGEKSSSREVETEKLTALSPMPSGLGGSLWFARTRMSDGKESGVDYDNENPKYKSKCCSSIN